jgi:hypothetical protein
VSVLRAALAAAAIALAAVALVLAADVRSWDDALRHGDRHADPALPGDPAGRLLSVQDDVAVRDALRAFAAAERAPEGFDSGLRRARLRSEAEALLGEVAAKGRGARPSQAENLIGILVHRTGRVADGTTGEDRTIGAFETAVRLDPTNADAKFNLELMLRRAQARGEREGPGSGSGPRGPGRRGAGAGSPGRGY